MKTIDYSTKSFSLFVPTHILAQGEGDGEVGKWKPINPDKSNWLQDSVWTEEVHTIIKLTEDIIVVIFNDYYCEKSGTRSHDSAVYKGTFE